MADLRDGEGSGGREAHRVRSDACQRARSEGADPVEQNGSVRRVSVVGNSGSGKSTVAAHLSAHLGVPHVELDAIFHQPGWLPLPAGEFRHRVALAAEGEGWVIDGDYSVVRDIVWRRADTVVWLDLPRVLVMRRVVGRTLARILLRRELWKSWPTDTSGPRSGHIHAANAMWWRYPQTG